MTQLKQSSSAKARRSAARLAAVQTLYQSLVRGQTARAAAGQTIHKMPKDEMNGEDMIAPDEDFKSALLKNMETTRQSLLSQLTIALKDREWNALEPLLQSILLLGASEIQQGEIDAPILINDYMNITHAFYAGTEPKLVNGVLNGLLPVK